MKNLYGIDETRPFVTLVSGLMTATVNIDKDGDGKIETNEILGALKNTAMDVFFKQPNLKDIKKEALDLSEIEKTILAQEFAEASPQLWSDSPSRNKQGKYYNQKISGVT